MGRIRAPTSTRTCLALCRPPTVPNQRFADLFDGGAIGASQHRLKLGELGLRLAARPLIAHRAGGIWCLYCIALPLGHRRLLAYSTASVPGAHAFASCARDLKLKCRSFHCYLGGPPAIP